MSDDITILTTRLEAAEQEVARLTALVKRRDTEPAPPPAEADTGDFTLARAVANLEMRVGAIEERESTRAGALQDISLKLDNLKTLVEKYPAVNPEDIQQILGLLRALPCASGCDPDHEIRRRLSSIPGGKVE